MCRRLGGRGWGYGYSLIFCSLVILSKLYNCRALPRLSLPCRARPSLTCLATPALPIRAIPRPASPCLARPRDACPAAPHHALPRQTSPCDACRALPCLAMPNLAYLAMPRAACLLCLLCLYYHQLFSRFHNWQHFSLIYGFIDFGQFLKVLVLLSQKPKII